MWNKFLPNLEDANLEGWVETLEDLDLGTYSRFFQVTGKYVERGRYSQFLSLSQICQRESFANRITGKNGRFEGQRSCFDIPGTENWRLRSIIEYNVNALFHPEGKLRIK